MSATEEKKVIPAAAEGRGEESNTRRCGRQKRRKQCRRLRKVIGKYEGFV